MFGYSKEAVRVKVKKCEGKLQPELRKFSVDPQITSLEVLQSILVKAFDIKSDFTLSYRSVDDYGQEVYLPLLSDWDLDAAFLKSHNIALTQRSEPCCQLKVEMKPFAEASEDWEPPASPAIQLGPLPPAREQPTVAQAQQQAEKQEPQTGFQGLIMGHVEKTFNIVSRALNLYEDPNTPPRPPLSDSEFRTFLDAVGQITNTAKLREVIYCGGIDPSLRKVVWKHILNVYPEGMTGRERMDYIKRKANEYYALRARWKDCIQKGKVNADLAYVTSMVRKDVLRTDRHHNFYAGSDDNQNIASLFNILTTYALNHPTVSYCQGMSDLASPLLVTMGDEAHAYICLCALMMRLYPNFLLDGEAMTLKFSHLTESLQVYDPDFYNYLKCQQADDLLFCYRWLLLEMKREFAFDDALRMLEVLWASLPQKTPPSELSLKEREFDPDEVESDDDPPPLSPLVKAPRENAYTKVCAMRRQSSSFSLSNVKTPKIATCRQMNHSLDENVTRSTTTTSPLKKDFQSLDDACLHLQKPKSDGNDNGVDKTKDSLANDLKSPRRNMKSVPEHVKAESETALSTGNLVNGNSHTDSKETTTPLGNQIRLLRDKISSHNNKFFTSLDKLDDSQGSDSNRPKVKMIRNLNEFLNFATGNKPAPPTDKLQRARSVIERSSRDCPRITLTKTSFDESDLDTQTKDVQETKLNKVSKSGSNDTNDGSSPDDSQEYYPMTTSMTRELRLELEHLDRQVFGPSYVNRCSVICDSPSDSTSTEEKPTNECTEIKQDGNTDVTDTLDTQTDATEIPGSMKKSPMLEAAVRPNAARSAEDIFLWENPLHRTTPTARTTVSCPLTPDEQAELDFDGDTGEIFEEHSGKKSITPIRLLRKNRSLEPQESYTESRISSTLSTDSDSSDKEPVVPIVPPIRNLRPDQPNTSRSNNFFSSMSQELENAKRNCESLLNAKQPNLHSVATTINNFQKKYEALKPPGQRVVTAACGSGDSNKFTIASLPPPSLFGGGNPFLMFLCLTVLLQHRDYIMRNRMDYNELAMHFDKMVRKHNVNRVLNQARQMYAIYLKHQAQRTGDITT
ncbi:rab-GTPase-TBC domain-containing protein [Phthorimaea operculella]|nr:rab-GTPase-TBC domain-containing protein [Phthorimaea operculella]